MVHIAPAPLCLSRTQTVSLVSARETERRLCCAAALLIASLYRLDARIFPQGSIFRMAGAGERGGREGGEKVKERKRER